ncbi:acyl-CoA dehydrogenase family protein [Pseudaquabacterium pictum]|uniref:Oxidoreductase n=1 Tax=Pseudaquabacterium pictum TaxID=2315236 RepID=A0A480B1T4_9BURK|nr:acyl-CoA dehydrogenase family protein [Rubrivivax pictus]GCL65835.1 oxidoreductase [Rubrivivax pictus]
MHLSDLPARHAAAHAVPDAHGQNLYDADPVLAQVLPLYLPADLLAHLQPTLQRLGGLAGGVLDTLAQTADQHPPTLAHRSRSGIDAQRILKHPDYMALERMAFSELGLAAMSHRGGVLGWPDPMPAAAKYALTYLFVQAEFGLCCPLSMTDSLARTLRRFGSADLVARHLPGLTTQVFDDLQQGAMFMTEQGAGSDVAATATRAVPDGDGYRLHGDKWFCSNPDAGLAMVLARIDDPKAGATAGMAGVSLFLLPRTLPDGRANSYRILRLKDKLGSRSMASGEIRMEGARAWLVGEAGRGFQQMADMVNNSRLSNGMRAAGLMRRALTEALFVARERRAFGQRLIDLPLMRRQLLKLMVPTEQARSMLFQTAEALRRADAGEPGAYPLARILTPLIKFRACRDARRVTGDAMEVRGGCGYIEEWADPRLLRDAHLGSIWEGTSNIVALDVVRAIQREGSLPVLQQHWQRLLAGTPLHPAARAVFDSTLARVAAVAQQVADARKAGDHQARQAASALYHATTATAMAWEAGRMGCVRRMRLAQWTLRTRLLPQDPLVLDAQPDWLADLLEPVDGSVDQALEAVQLLG